MEENSNRRQIVGASPPALATAPVIIFQAFNIVLAEQGTVLQLHHNGCRRAFVGESVSDADRDVDPLTDAEAKLPLTDEHGDFSVGENPVFSAVTVALERKAFPRQNLDALEHGVRKDFEDAP